MSSFPYVPLDHRGWRLAMGLRPLDEATWLEVDAQRDAELAQKNDLLEHHRELVVARTSFGDAPSEELLEAVLENLATYHPGLSREIRVGEIPLVQASLLVQEDLCVLVRDDEWKLAAACVYFPSRWDLAQKIGTSLDVIHSPVPGYEEALAGPTNAFFERLDSNRSFWRLNWTLLDDPALHQTSRRESARASLEQWYFRVERQTMRKLPRTGAVVFTIRTYVASLWDMHARDTNFVPMLLVSLDSAPPATVDYKGWRGVADRLRDMLRDEITNE